VNIKLHLLRYLFFEKNRLGKAKKKKKKKKKEKEKEKEKINEPELFTMKTKE